MRLKPSKRFRLAAVFCFALPLVFAATPTPAADGSEAAWKALAAPGTVALMRHARAPGTGDPPDFELGDCATQRNLDEVGREQARATGHAFRERGIAVARVLTSEWCRARDTAALLDVAPVEAFPPLNSFFRDRERAPEQTAAVRDFLADWNQDGTLVLVTHQVNISGLVGTFTRSGEVVVARPDERGELEVLGTIAPR